MIRRKHRGSRRGTTLLEMLIATAILLLITTGAIVFFQTVQSRDVTADHRFHANEDVNLLMQKAGTELRMRLGQGPGEPAPIQFGPSAGMNAPCQNLLVRHRKAGTPPTIRATVFRTVCAGGTMTSSSPVHPSSTCGNGTLSQVRVEYYSDAAATALLRTETFPSKTGALSMAICAQPSGPESVQLDIGALALPGGKTPPIRRRGLVDFSFRSPFLEYQAPP